MRLTTPRLPPLPVAEWSQEARELLSQTASASDERALNIFATLARHPKLLKRWLVFGGHILRKSSLSPRQRELAILRVGWLCGSEYEWGQHVMLARGVGITDEEIRRVAEGPEAPGWDTEERVILRATDELHTDFMIGEETWQQLSRRFDERQMLDLVFTVGQYHLVSMALNTFGVQLDAGYPGFEESVGRRPPRADTRRGAAHPHAEHGEGSVPARPGAAGAAQRSGKGAL